MRGIKKNSLLCILILALSFLGSNGMPQEGDPDNGVDLYAQKCATCHGPVGAGGTAQSLRSCRICDSFQDLFDKINTEMPSGNPQDCIDLCAYDTAAFIFLYLNGHEDNGGGCFIRLSAE